MVLKEIIAATLIAGTAAYCGDRTHFAQHLSGKADKGVPIETQAADYLSRMPDSVAYNVIVPRVGTMQADYRIRLVTQSTNDLMSSDSTAVQFGSPLYQKLVDMSLGLQVNLQQRAREHYAAMSTTSGQ